MNKKIGIVVPIYNVEKFLNDCLESILNQTYGNFECVLIDDGSLDKSDNISRAFVDLDSRFVLLKKTNGGLSSARNLGIEWFKYKNTNVSHKNFKDSFIKFSRYKVNEIYTNNNYNETYKIDYIVFLDSDDIWDLNLLYNCVSNLKNEDLIWFDYQCFYDRCDKVEHRTVMEYCNFKEKKVITPLEWLEYIRKSELRFFWFSVCGLIKFSFLEKIELFFIDGIIHEDHHFGTLIFSQAKNIVVYPSKPYYYRIRSGSIMNHSGEQIELSPPPLFLEKIYDFFERYDEAKFYHKTFSWIETAYAVIRFIESCKDNELSKKIEYCFLKKLCNWSLAIFDIPNDPLNLKQDDKVKLIKKYIENLKIFESEK
ncbi:TPA: glycosyltransferase family 2 protein [Campylobacter lari]|nr:glycosyltransferase family 2 protein [Campylobacter lari]